MKPNQYEPKQDPIFQDFILERNLQPETIKNYNSALQKYCQYNQMTLQELLNEADDEEERQVRAKRRTIVKRLKNFRTYLIKNKNETNTINGYYTKVRTFYRHHLIEIPNIPSAKLNKKQVMYEEIPHKEHIIECLEHTSNLKHRAIIYFMSSSGTARNETCNLTIQNLMDATYDYHKSNTIHIALEKLETLDNVIPIFQITRSKTNYRYYTACTPEATEAIIRWLKYRGYKNLKPEDTVFDVKPNSINKLFERLNKSCKYPKGFLHPHALRSYHTDIIQDKPLTTILQGRRPDPITEAYYKQNPKRIREQYLRHVEDLTIRPSEVITIESDEVKKLKKEIQEERELNAQLNDEIQNIRGEVTDLKQDIVDMIRYYQKNEEEK